MACGAEVAINPRAEQFNDKVLAFDGKRCGRIILARLSDYRLPSANRLGNVTVAATATCGAGYRDATWECGASYSPRYVPWTLERNLKEILNWTARGDFRAMLMRTHTLPFTSVKGAWELLLERPEQPLSVLLAYDN